MASSDVKLPEPVGYVSKTGHGTYFRETLTPELRALEWAGQPVWTMLYDEPTVRRLAAEVEALRAYAERYRWLREHGDAGCTEKDGYGGQTLRMGEWLDAAIDAAKKEVRDGQS